MLLNDSHPVQLKEVVKVVAREVPQPLNVGALRALSRWFRLVSWPPIAPPTWWRKEDVRRCPAVRRDHPDRNRVAAGRRGRLVVLRISSGLCRLHTPGQGVQKIEQQYQWLYWAVRLALLSSANNRPTWWSSPLSVSGISGRFNAPADASNDDRPVAALAALILFAFYAINRAKLANSPSISRKVRFHGELVATRIITGFPGFPWLCSPVTNQPAPHSDSAGRK